MSDITSTAATSPRPAEAGGNTNTRTKRKSVNRNPTFEFQPAAVPPPFCYGHSMFYQFWYKNCNNKGDSLVLARLAALQQCMIEHHGSSTFIPNDVDFFTSSQFKEHEVLEKVQQFNTCQMEYVLKLQQQSRYSINEPYYRTGIHSVWNFWLSHNLPEEWFAPVVIPSP